MSEKSVSFTGIQKKLVLSFIVVALFVGAVAFYAQGLLTEEKVKETNLNQLQFSFEGQKISFFGFLNGDEKSITLIEESYRFIDEKTTEMIATSSEAERKSLERLREISFNAYDQKMNQEDPQSTSILLKTRQHAVDHTLSLSKENLNSLFEYIEDREKSLEHREQAEVFVDLVNEQRAKFLNHHIFNMGEVLDQNSLYADNNEILRLIEEALQNETEEEWRATLLLLEKNQKYLGEEIDGFVESSTAIKHQVTSVFLPLHEEFNSLIGELRSGVSISPSNSLIFVPAMFLLVIVGIMGSGFLFSRSISNPIKSLYTATKEVEKGDFSARVNILTGDELEELGSAFNKTTEALGHLEKEHKQIDQAKTRFLSITSHELRSPMTPMKAQLQMLIEGYYGKLNKKQKESLGMIIRNADRLDKIVVDFLEISRIEAARLKFHFRQTDLKKTVNEVIDYMKGFMPEKNIKLTAKIEDLPIIEVDPDRVSQVLRNLINNAIKFTPEGKEVKVTARKAGNFIEFSVQDEGIGISPEDQLRIFEPFFQAEQTIYRKKGGTGLGLAICKGIIRSQNGDIWIVSKPGKSTTFYFTVPLKPVREIKPIKVLFSEKESIELKTRDIFTEILGPMGEVEFQDFIKENKITKGNLFKYIKNLHKLQILSKQECEEFRGKVSTNFEIDKEKGSVKPEKSEPHHHIKKWIEEY